MTLLMVTSMHTTAGESLETFLQESAEGQFHAVQLQSFSQESGIDLTGSKLKRENKNMVNS